MVELVARRIDDHDAAALIDALLDDLAERYGGRDAFHPDPESLAPPDGVFVIARLDGVPVGCGGFGRFTDGVAETGTNQPEAMALYQRAGYRAMVPYGHYRDSPMSRCFEKDLRP